MFLGRCPTAFRRRPCLRRWPCRSAWKALRHSAFFKTMLFSAHFGVRQSKVSSRNSFRDGLLRLSLKDTHILTLGCILLWPVYNNDEARQNRGRRSSNASHKLTKVTTSPKTYKPPRSHGNTQHLQATRNINGHACPLTSKRSPILGRTVGPRGAQEFSNLLSISANLPWMTSQSKLGLQSHPTCVYASILSFK